MSTALTLSSKRRGRDTRREERHDTSEPDELRFEWTSSGPMFVGPKVRQPSLKTKRSRRRAVQVLEEQLDHLVGTDFYGRVSIEVIFEAGQIVRLQHSRQMTYQP
jgi:hypothetical protein